MKLQRFALAAVAILAIGFGTAKAGLFSAFPIVGWPSYCSAFGNDNLCTNTVPAGPALTGNETLAADTNLSQGRNPQTALIKPASLNAGPYAYVAPLTGATITVTNLQRQVIIEPAGTIASLTIAFPAGNVAAAPLVDNQRIGFCSTQTVTALTVTAGAGNTVVNPPTALAAPVTTGAGGGCYEFIYRQLTASTGTWYRVQ